MRATFDKFSIAVGAILWLLQVNWWSQIFALSLITWMACDLFWGARWTRFYTVEIKISACLFVLWVMMAWNWGPITRQYSNGQEEKQTLTKKDILATVREALSGFSKSQVEEAKRETTKSADVPKLEVKPAIPEKKVDEKKKQATEPAVQLAIDGVDDPTAMVPQTGQARQPKVTKFARIRVSSLGNKSIGDVKLVVTSVGGRDVRLQLPLASIDTLFVSPPSPVVGSANLNPGDDQLFDAIVECNGITCPNGELAIVALENGRRIFATSLEKGVVNTIPNDEITVRASGNVGGPATKIFRVSIGSQGQLVLKPKTE